MTGTASRNTEPHQKNWSRKPPTSGPMAAPTEKLEIQMPIANVRCFASWNMLRISDMVDGINVAPAIPRMARVTISISALFEKAARIDAAANAPAPIISSRRRPIRSPNVPIVMSEPAIMNP